MTPLPMAAPIDPAGPDVGPEDEQVAEVMREVWASYPDIALEPVPGRPGWCSTGLGGPVVTATVRISGAWQGQVVLVCPAALAGVAAARMLGVPEGEIQRADVHDALGELTNVAGGNLKSLFPAPSTLSLPVVIAGPAMPPPGAALLNDVLLDSSLGPVAVSAWRRATT